MFYHNTFKQGLRERRPQFGLWLSLAESYTAEVCATAGFDWLLLDGEHAPNDVRSLLAQMQAVSGYPVTPVVRVVEGTSTWIKQLLDVGARNLLVPMVETPDQARELVAATRYPPIGTRGVGGGAIRAARWGARPSYLHEADEEVCLVLQVESALAMQNLDAICAIEGVDGIFIGPADLAASVGHRGNPGHPHIQALTETGLKTIVTSGKAAGIIATDPALVESYLSLGATFVAVGVDVMLLAQGARNLSARFVKPQI